MLQRAMTVVVAVLCTLPASADVAVGEARRVVEEAEGISLASASIETEQGPRLPVIHFRVAGPDGTAREYYVDARSGRYLGFQCSPEPPPSVALGDVGDDKAVALARAALRRYAGPAADALSYIVASRDEQSITVQAQTSGNAEDAQPGDLVGANVRLRRAGGATAGVSLEWQDEPAPGRLLTREEALAGLRGKLAEEGVSAETLREPALRNRGGRSWWELEVQRSDRDLPWVYSVDASSGEVELTSAPAGFAARPTDGSAHAAAVPEARGGFGSVRARALLLGGIAGGAAVLALAVAVVVRRRRR